MTIIIVALMAANIGWSVFHPTVANDDEVDAVVVLAGGYGERLSAALELMEFQGDSTTLVLSVGNREWAGWADLEPYCTTPQDYSVVCVEAIPDDTAGEAGSISALAKQEGWQVLGVVTSTYHLARSTLRFERCFDGKVSPFEASTSTDRQEFEHEFLGLVEARILDRNCDPNNGTIAKTQWNRRAATG